MIESLIPGGSTGDSRFSGVSTTGADFGKNVKEWCQQTTGKTLPTVIRGAIKRLFIAIVNDTPIDTGRFVSHWTLGKGAPEFTNYLRMGNSRKPMSKNEYVREYTFINKNAKAEKIAEIRAYFNNEKGNWQHTYNLTNNLPYGHKLEYLGHSKQAPKGMVRKNEDKFQQFLREAIADPKGG